jgi:hypothetical protein
MRRSNFILLQSCMILRLALAQNVRINCITEKLRRNAPQAEPTGDKA